MTLQYLRKLSCVVGSGSSALDFSAFRVTFTVRRGDIQTPNSADIRIYNLSDNTANRIKNEFTTVILQAGYEGNFGLLFQGTIKQVRKGRVDQKDSYVDITAADGDEAYNFARLSIALRAGYTPADVVQQFLTSFGSFGIKRGYVPARIADDTNGAVRGRTFHGMTRDLCREFAVANSCAWNLNDGVLNFIPYDSYIPGPIPVIGPTTGLIGVPEQTQNGVLVRTLLNPNVKVGSLFRLDGTVNQQRIGLDVLSTLSNQNLAQGAKVSASGLYYSLYSEHSGDTRAEPWFTDVTCLAADATKVPIGLLPKGTVFDPTDVVPLT